MSRSNASLHLRTKQRFNFFWVLIKYQLNTRQARGGMVGGGGAWQAVVAAVLQKSFSKLWAVSISLRRKVDCIWNKAYIMHIYMAIYLSLSLFFPLSICLFLCVCDALSCCPRERVMRSPKITRICQGQQSEGCCCSRSPFAVRRCLLRWQQCGHFVFDICIWMCVWAAILFLMLFCSNCCLPCCFHSLLKVASNCIAQG